MDDPIQDVSSVVRSLCQGSPNEQKAALEEYFVDDAAFYHPFCRVDSFPGSRSRLLAIFRWYKIMSPKITLDIKSVAYDEVQKILYVTIRQDFAIWFLFGLHNSDVTLTTVLQLEKQKNKYYIQSQNDLYQTDQFMRFCTIPRGFGAYLVIAWQWLATLACILFANLFSFITVAEQWYADEGQQKWEQFRSRNVVKELDETTDKLVGDAKEGAQQVKKKVHGKVNGVK